MLWKILALAACAVVAWTLTRPLRATRNNNPARDNDSAKHLALCNKCGVYHDPDADCNHPDNPDKPRNDSGPRNNSNPGNDSGPRNDSNPGNNSDSDKGKVE